MVQRKLMLAPFKYIRLWQVNIYKENSDVVVGGDNNDNGDTGDDDDADAGVGRIGDGDFEGNFRDVRLYLSVMDIGCIVYLNVI
jgi:hypothetical protein